MPSPGRSTFAADGAMRYTLKLELLRLTRCSPRVPARHWAIVSLLVATAVGLLLAFASSCSSPGGTRPPTPTWSVAPAEATATAVSQTRAGQILNGQIAFAPRQDMVVGLEELVV